MKRLIKFVPYLIIAIVAAGIIFAFVKKNDSSASSTGVTDTPVIIIDAGHGNPDGGAVAADGTEEQYINLDIAIKLNDALTAKGYKTLMTRTDNNAIHDEDALTIREKKVSDLHKRLEIANQNPDSIFVSIHQNYYTESRYWGTQVFYSPNNVQSSQLAQCIQSCVVSELQPDNTRQIKESGDSIYLLYHAETPAVMVECGFLSNYEDTEKLEDNEYRQQMADSICNGIINYLNDGNSEAETVGEV